MLASTSVLVRLHCPDYGRPVMVEYYRSVQTEDVKSPIWFCPYFDCESTLENPLIGARQIVGVRPLRLGQKV